MDRNVLEFADHLHEHFVYPVSINDKGRYNVPTDPHGGYRCVSFSRSRLIRNTSSRGDFDSIEMYTKSIAEYEWPNGSYWVGAKGKVPQ
jgi:L-fuconate dehydratase